jgi:hypothetical protein
MSQMLACYYYAIGYNNLSWFSGEGNIQHPERPPGEDQENEELCTPRLYAAFSAARIIL